MSQKLPKKILLINKFLYPKGGDAISTLATGDLLRSRGHDVVFWGMHHPLNPKYDHQELFVDNLDLNNNGGIKKKIDVAGKILYSFEARQKIDSLVRKIGKPDIVHLHNFAHQISPSILDVFKKYKIPVVMTMHDYKMVCASYTLLSHGKLCEKCAHGKFNNCFFEGCVKGSKAKSLLNTIEMQLHHNLLHIYDAIHTFIAPSEFLKNKLEQMGFKKRIVHIPNFIKIANVIPSYNPAERSVVFFGRLSHEKGITTLIEAIRGLDIKLKIMGDGPLKEALFAMVKEEKIRNVLFLGYKSGDDLKDEIHRSMFVVIPSEWYENNPLSALEAFALAKPVIGARIGGIPELVQDNVTGSTFESGNASDLRSKIIELADKPDKIVYMGKKARLFVEGQRDPEMYYQQIMETYQTAIQGGACVC